MAQTIKIKRSTGSAAPTTIAAGELAYSKGSGILYIGDPNTANANTPLPINDPDRWMTFTSDSGNTTADTSDDTLSILGGTGIDTAISGDTLTITLNAALQNLNNVNDTAPGAGQDGYVLTWDNTAGEWQAQAGAAGSLEGLSDTTIDTVADNELLAYDSTSSKWINQTPTEAGFATVATSGSYNDLSNTPTIPSAANNATITIAAGTALTTGGDFTTDQSVNETITLNHADITRTNNTSTASPAHGGTFTAIDTITTNAQGHVTAVNTKTVTLPTETGTNLGNSATGTALTVTSSTGDNTDLPAATTTTWGVMTDEDKTKLDGIATSANNYTHPAYTTRSIDTSGVDVLDTFTSDAIGSVTGITTRTLPDATTSSAGVMSATDKTKLDGIETSADVTDKDNVKTALASLNETDTLFIGDAGNDTAVSIRGNLTVTGTTTTVNTETINLADNIILLNSNETGVPSQDAGIEVERGTSTNVSLVWDENAGRWTFTNNGTNYFNIPTSTEYTDNTGTVTSVGGTGTVNGISLSGSVTTSGNLTLGGTLSGITVSQLATSAIQDSGDLSSPGFSDDDTSLLTAAAIDDRILSYGYTANAGDITEVTLRNGEAASSNGDISILVSGGNSGTASSGAASFTLAVGTIDGGTYP